MLTQEIIRELSRPFSEDELQIRLQSGQALVYINARAVMKRLDDVVGAENWFDEYVPVNFTRTVKDKTDYICGFRCKLTVLGVTKEDVGDPEMAEPFKSAASSALKRAAVKFGIGAYLYDMKNLPTDTTYEDLSEDAQAGYLTPDDHVLKLYNSLSVEQQTTAQGLFTESGYVLSKNKVSTRDIYKQLKELTK